MRKEDIECVTLTRENGQHDTPTISIKIAYEIAYYSVQIEYYRKMASKNLLLLYTRFETLTLTTFSRMSIFLLEI